MQQATQLSTAENGIDNNELELVTLGDTLTGLTNDVVANDGEIENLKAAVAAVDVEVTEVLSTIHVCMLTSYSPRNNWILSSQI